MFIGHLSKSLIFASFCLSAINASAETYDEAERRSAGYSATQAETEWYENKMQPAFREALASSVPVCLKAVSAERPERVDLVFVVEGDGQVNTVYWKEPSAFSKCLQPAITGARFPTPPGKNFYFGVGFRLPPKKPD